MIPRNLQISENGHWVLHDTLDQRQQNDCDSKRKAGNLYNDLEAETCSTLIIADRLGLLPDLKLEGCNLAPSTLLVMSPDGRKVACMTMDQQICVWSAYAVRGLIPDYDLLTIGEKLDEEDYVETLMKDIGVSMLNYPATRGMSLLQHALMDGKAQLRNWLLKWAADNSIKVRISCPRSS